MGERQGGIFFIQNFRIFFYKIDINTDMIFRKNYSDTDGRSLFIISSDLE